MKVTVLSPSMSNLQKLRKKYPADKNNPFEHIESESISEAKAVKQNDYHIPIENFNLNTWKEDNSVENGSSISVMTEFQNKRILWLADAHPSVIITALKGLGYSKNNPLNCNWVKVTHHGSSGNNSNELYEMIKCENYLMSANGENLHCLPTKECIARIIRNDQRLPDSHYKFYFTYDNHLLRNIFAVDGELAFKKLNFSTFFHIGISKMIKV
jgi:beta-lactamase superfamily II metal-dependent hydrolase